MQRGSSARPAQPPKACVNRRDDSTPSGNNYSYCAQRAGLRRHGNWACFSAESHHRPTDSLGSGFRRAGHSSPSMVADHHVGICSYRLYSFTDEHVGAVGNWIARRSRRRPLSLHWLLLCMCDRRISGESLLAPRRSRGRGFGRNYRRSGSDGQRTQVRTTASSEGGSALDHPQSDTGSRAYSRNWNLRSHRQRGSHGWPDLRTAYRAIAESFPSRRSANAASISTDEPDRAARAFSTVGVRSSEAWRSRSTPAASTN